MQASDYRKLIQTACQVNKRFYIRFAILCHSLVRSAQCIRECQHKIDQKAISQLLHQPQIYRQAVSLPIALAGTVMRSVASVRPFVSAVTFEPPDLDFCTFTGHDVIGQGHGNGQGQQSRAIGSVYGNEVGLTSVLHRRQFLSRVYSEKLGAMRGGLARQSNPLITCPVYQTSYTSCRTAQNVRRTENFLSTECLRYSLCSPHIYA